MRKIVIQEIILVISSLMLLSFSGNNRTYQTECVSIESDGYVVIKIWDTKKGAKYSAEQARKDAVNAVLFSGVAAGNNCKTQPPILNTHKEQENFKSIDKAFFAKNGKWILFTRSSATTTNLPVNLGAQNWKVYQVSVSKNELRKYLEEQKIITTLNMGF
ncbi:MAG: hypothetical protein EOM23_00945 [Candidatus Moranbacteria bacterium]|nr:hypothetical protein [Candidatus Moranbacteria bacterium]